jgi:hypothetical protein
MNARRPNIRGWFLTLPSQQNLLLSREQKTLRGLEAASASPSTPCDIAEVPSRPIDRAGRPPAQGGRAYDTAFRGPGPATSSPFSKPTVTTMSMIITGSWPMASVLRTRPGFTSAS